MDITLSDLEYECNKLRKRLSDHEDLQSEVEMLKDELETSLESHKKLQDVALAFEEENRTIQDKYTEQLKDKSKLNAVNIELEHEVETRNLSYEQLQKKYDKIRKEKEEVLQEMEEHVCTVENGKNRDVETIKELQDCLEASYEDSENRSKELQKNIDKLLQENTELNTKLETYFAEMEDMDCKVEQLENENELLKNRLEKMKEMQMFGTQLQFIEELELEKTQLLLQLEKEREEREEVENELFKTEEELETYLSRDHHVHSGSHLPTINENEVIMDDLDGYARTALQEKETVIRNLEVAKKRLLERITELEEEREVLLEENGMLAKSNVDLQQMECQSNDVNENKISHLEEKVQDLTDKLHDMADERQDLAEKLQDMTDERKHIERDKFNRLVTSAEKEFEHSQKQKEESRENDRLRNEIKVAQRCLDMTKERNVDLQTEMERKEKEYEGKLDDVKEELKTELHSLKLALEAGTLCQHRDQNQSFQDSPTSHKEWDMEQVKLDYENKVSEQNSTIRNLEDQITQLRSFYENKSISTTSSTGTPPCTVRSVKYCGSMVELRNLSNGGNSRTYEVQEVAENEDGLGEREMRRISYKVAEGTWKRLSCELPINEQHLSQIMNSTANGQEKVYQLLNCWRTETKIPRVDLLKELTEYIDPNRKDVIKFLKDMAGISQRERTSIKTRFRKLRNNVKR